ncbi:fragment of prepilin, shufflon protein (C-ter part) [Escherichia coli]|uniref:Fragment of prepilin, shufflon protein (C-ter part) n=1 Tax=Escherichia coli TaxID=562 RepID=A0A376ZZI1_ECOLX|nr:fragment of prepilin, shufflon protein (C-ter part) [Escherichia coli]
MPTIILCKRANPVPGALLNSIHTQTYNIAKNTRNLRLGVHAYCSWTYLNGSPFGGFQQVYSDQNNVWYVSNYAWGNYESGGTISVTCLNLPVLELN